MPEWLGTLSWKRLFSLGVFQSRQVKKYQSDMKWELSQEELKAAIHYNKILI